MNLLVKKSVTYFPLYPSSPEECNAAEYADFCKRCKTDSVVIKNHFFFFFSFFLFLFIFFSWIEVLVKVFWPNSSSGNLIFFFLPTHVLSAVSFGSVCWAQFSVAPWCLLHQLDWCKWVQRQLHTLFSFPAHIALCFKSNKWYIYTTPPSMDGIGVFAYGSIQRAPKMGME